MTGTKQYRYRLDSEGRSGIKEEIRRLNREKEFRRITLSVGIREDLEQADRMVFKRGRLEQDSQAKEGVYYLLEEIAYIVTVRYEERADGTTDARVTMIHVPEKIKTEEKIECKLVTQYFSEEVKEEILKNLESYIREQISKKA